MKSHDIHTSINSKKESDYLWNPHVKHWKKRVRRNKDIMKNTDFKYVCWLSWVYSDNKKYISRFVRFERVFVK